MRNLTTDEGKAQFGDAFRNWDHYVVKHATAVQTLSGDQAHNGPCFMTFHRLLLLEIERVLLSIRPEFKALPYWDMALDSAIGGKYTSKDEEFIISDKYFGSYTGNPNKDYAVTDGAFAYWPVTKYDAIEFEQYADIYNGSATSGYNRAFINPNNVSYVTRFDKSGFIHASPLLVLEENINICAQYAYIKTWEQWGLCVDTVADSRASITPYGIYTIEGKISTLPWFHAQPHVKIGSMQPSTGFLGDFMDTSTSVNDPIFLFHHTNIDRLNQKWQVDAEANNATLGDNDVLWGFPTVLPESNVSVTGWPINAGCWLRSSEVSWRFPFYPTEVFGPGANGTCPGSGVDGIYTHSDALKYTKPTTSNYVYDSEL